MKIYTRTGDKGETGLFGGARVPKDEARIEANGAIDEANAMIGLDLAYGSVPLVVNVLAEVQADLFTLGAELSAMSGHEDRLGIPLLLASQAEISGGRVTGKVKGIPSFREGKVRRLEAWIDESGADLAKSSFYSDSHNDLPLLEYVARPVAVDPDPELKKAALERGWEIISLR